MLYKILDSLKFALGDDHFTSRVDSKIIKNLNQKFALRDYQSEAIGRLSFYLDDYKQKAFPTHLLFHMATGSGKTLIMAANILQLYMRGYRFFVFFVSSSNIIEKTRENFLNQSSNKFLFSDNVRIGPNNVRITEVDNFETSNSDDIQILFTTIQGLHSNLNTPKENQITYEDFEDRKIVLLSDEAHHINTITKSHLNKGELEEKHSWEGTVQRIFTSNRENVLLEYTATIDLSHQSINQKYEDKIIFQYDLKHFRLDGFSKEIEVLETDREPIDRALQAILVSQYKRKIAEKNGIQLKPVILFKSNYVNEPSKPNPNAVVSSVFKKCLLDKIQNLQVNDLNKFRKSNSELIKKIFHFFDDNEITINNLIDELKIDFKEERCLSIDSNEEKDINQILVNSLEDKDNEIRAVFAVEMLNEGWDVLNLYDIVRLYNTRDSKNNRPGKTTIAEAQLIGRGARYYPFKYNNSEVIDKRKFDDDNENELRVIEQLHYHSAQNPRYIAELKSALIDIGIIPEKYIELPLNIKEDFKKTDFWKSGLVFSNERIINTRDAIYSLLDVNIHLDHEFHIWTGETYEGSLFANGNQSDEKQNNAIIRYSLSDFGENVINSAMDRLDFYKFSSLRKYFPKLRSKQEFITSEKYLGDVKVSVNGDDEIIKNLSQKHKLEICIHVLSNISDEAIKNSPEYEGTKLFKAKRIQDVFKDKVIKIAKDSPRAQSSDELNLIAHSWYAQNELYGTSEEKDFIEFFQGVMAKLEEKYDQIALIRNERTLPIFDFAEGRRFEPDFLLFLKNRENKKLVAHQVFIEPKGNQFKDQNGGFSESKEGWKQEFLQQLESNVSTDLKLENTKFRLLGLPFYNKDLESVFEKSFDEMIL